jgi:Uma2 family endonuclease
MITSLDQLDPNGTYTYADYLTWQFEERIELLKGFIREMSAPNRFHQKISNKINTRFSNFLWKKPCEVYYAPFDVRLVKNPEGKSKKDIYTVVQPDLCVICDLSKLDEQGCIGAPDLIIEIVSPKNSKRDVQEKFEIYEESGVREYWIVFPNDLVINQFYLVNEKYQFQKTYTATDTISPLILPELVINLEEVFEQ